MHCFFLPGVFFKFKVQFRGVFRTQSSIYYGALLQIQLTILSRQMFSQKCSIVDVQLGSKYASAVQHILPPQFNLYHFLGKLQQFWGQNECCESLLQHLIGHHLIIHATSYITQQQIILIGYARKPSTSLHNRDLFTHGNISGFGKSHILCGTTINISSGDNTTTSQRGP